MTDRKQKLWSFPLVILVVMLVAYFCASKFYSIILNNYLHWHNAFWTIAFGWSTFLALYAFQLHTSQYADDPKDVRVGYGGLRWSQRIHQFALNFGGGMVGWTMLYLFIYTDYFSTFAGWEKLVLLLISFLAVMGYLPYTLIIKSWLPGR